MAQAVEVIGTYEDHTGKKATNTMYVVNGLTLAQYTEGLRAAASIIDGIVGTILTGLNFCVSVDLTGLTDNAAEPLSDVEEIGAFQFLTDENRPVNVNVPGIIDTLSGTGTDDLPEAAPEVAAIISMMEDGLAVTGGTILPCDVDEGDITSTAFAREEVRNSGSRS